MAQDISTGLVGWWKLDDGAGTVAKDSSGSANTGNFSGGTLWTTIAQIGPFAVFLDGTDDVVNCGSGASLDDLANMTLACWINPTAQGYALGKGDAGGNGFLIGPIASGGNFFVRFSQDFSVSAGTWDTNTGILLGNRWQHIAATYNRSSVLNDPVIYIDGIARSIASEVSPVGTAKLDAAFPFFIGNRCAPPDGIPFPGRMDDVRIYNRLLAADDVRFLYDQKYINGSMLLMEGLH